MASPYDLYQFNGTSGDTINIAWTREWRQRSLENLPCCGRIEPRRLKELPHVSGFDLDLLQCPRCQRDCMNTFFNVGGWESVTAADVANMTSLEGAEWKVFMKVWSEKVQLTEWGSPVGNPGTAMPSLGSRAMTEYLGACLLHKT